MKRYAAYNTLLLVACLLCLAGCASNSAGSSAGKTTDISTESDESDVRKRARIRMELAIGYFEQGKTNIALDELKQVISVDPTFPDAYGLRGLIYMRLNEMGQADESFRRALALNPRDGNTLHNYGWMQCQQARFAEATKLFSQALQNPLYLDRAKTYMIQGICHLRAGQPGDAESSFARSYELDAINPVTGFNLANLLFRRADYGRAQFYIRRLNNSEFANAESLWLGIKVENQLNDQVALNQLGDQLRKRFPASRESASFDRKAFNE
jgi:type IV pilus assembly protein PilF